jgi:hypothetical protein
MECGTQEIRNGSAGKFMPDEIGNSGTQVTGCKNELLFLLS